MGIFSSSEITVTIFVYFRWSGQQFVLDRRWTKHNWSIFNRYSTACSCKAVRWPRDSNRIGCDSRKLVPHILHTEIQLYWIWLDVNFLYIWIIEHFESCEFLLLSKKRAAQCIWIEFLNLIRKCWNIFFEFLFRTNKLNYFSGENV